MNCASKRRHTVFYRKVNVVSLLAVLRKKSGFTKAFIGSMQYLPVRKKVFLEWKDELFYDFTIGVGHNPKPERRLITEKYLGGKINEI